VVVAIETNLQINVKFESNRMEKNKMKICPSNLKLQPKPYFSKSMPWCTILTTWVSNCLPVCLPACLHDAFRLAKLIAAKAMGFFHCLMSLQPERCLLAYCSTCNAFFMDLLVSSFVFHSSLLTVKSVDLVVARDGFLCITETVFFIVATLIIEVLFKQLLICTAV